MEHLRKIWWIASFPKSGNTLVRLFINAYVTKFPVDLNANYQYATIDQQPQYFQHVCPKPLSEVSDIEFVYLMPSMLMHYIQLIEPRDACFKTHHANIEIDGIPLIFPRLTKQAVYLVRDPRDVAISYAHHSGVGIDAAIDIMANNNHVGKRDHNIRDVICSWSTHVDSWGKCKFPVTMIKFEDLVNKKEESFRKILPALGFRDICESSFWFAMEQTEFSNLKDLEIKNKFKEAKHGEFFRVGKTGQWRSALTEEQTTKIELNHKHSMRNCGYNLEFIKD